MEINSCALGGSPLAVELSRGRELTLLLEGQLAQSCPAELCDLVRSILASWENAMLMAVSGCCDPSAPVPALEMESPRSVGDGSPRSGASELSLKDLEQQHKASSRKRKALPTWARQVRACAGTGLEGHPDDGYSWRKYGQKEILGAKHPRGYFRCTHRFTQGCQATKHVQRSDHDMCVFEITYRGSHTCSRRTQPSLTAAPRPQDYDGYYGGVAAEDALELKLPTTLKVKEDEDTSCARFTALLFTSTTPAGGNDSVVFSLDNDLADSSINHCCFSPITFPSTPEPNFWPSWLGEAGGNMPRSGSDLSELVSPSITSTPRNAEFEVPIKDSAELELDLDDFLL